MSFLSIALNSRPARLPFGPGYTAAGTRDSLPYGSCITCVVMPVKYSIVKDQTSPAFTEDAENHLQKRFLSTTFGFSLDSNRHRRWFVFLVGLGRFELPTSPLSGVRSNQLSYRPKVIGGAGRDRTGGLLNANQALSQLSYSPLLPVGGPSPSYI